MGSIQTILVIVVVSLTLLLLIVGVQVIMIIVDARRALKKLNAILEDSILGGGLIRPEKLTGVLELVRKKLQKRGEGEV